MKRILTCGYCWHEFDSRDKRGYVAPDKHGHVCPACWMMKIRSSSGWAVWNSCNGIFEVEQRRSAAVKLLSTPEYADCECSVIPVRVIEVPPEDRHLYEWQEQQLIEGHDA